MPSPHRINVVVPSRAYILKVQREAKKRKVSIAQLFRDALDYFLSKND